MSDKLFIEVEIIHGGGQPTNYADHLYEYIATFSVPEGQAWFRKFGEDEKRVREYLKPYIGTIPDWEKKNWPSYTLEIFEPISPGKWHIRYTYPYID